MDIQNLRLASLRNEANFVVSAWFNRIGAFTNTGHVRVAPGGRLNFQAAGSFAGSFQVDDGLISADGAADWTANVVISRGSLNFSQGSGPFIGRHQISSSLRLESTQPFPSTATLSIRNADLLASSIIHGKGFVGGQAGVRSQGTIRADVSGEKLTVREVRTEGLVEAINGALVDIDPFGAISGHYRAVGPGSTTKLMGTYTLNGATFEATGGGKIVFSGTATSSSTIDLQGSAAQFSGRMNGGTLRNFNNALFQFSPEFFDTRFEGTLNIREHGIRLFGSIDVTGGIAQSGGEVSLRPSNDFGTGLTVTGGVLYLNTYNPSGPVNYRGHAILGGDGTLNVASLMAFGAESILEGNGTFTSNGSNFTSHGLVKGDLTFNRSSTTGQPIKLFGKVEPGFGIGTLTFDERVALGSSTLVDFEIGQSIGDQIRVNVGSLQLGGTARIRFQDGVVPVAGTSWTIVQGAYTGTFATLNMPSNLRMNYLSNSVSVSVVPEPSIFIAMVTGAGVVFGRRRRTQRD